MMTEEQIDTCVELARKILDKLGYVVFVKVQSMRNELPPQPCFMCGRIGEPPLYLLAYRAKLKPINNAPEIAFEIDDVYRIGTPIRVDKGAAGLPALNLRAALPNLLDLDVLMSLSDKWAADRGYNWVDAFYSRIAEYGSHLIDGYCVPCYGKTQQEARLAAWLNALNQPERNV